MSLFRQRGANDSLIFYYYFFTQVHDFLPQQLVSNPQPPSQMQPRWSSCQCHQRKPHRGSNLKLLKQLGGNLNPGRIREREREREKKYANQTLPPSLSLSQHIYANQLLFQNKLESGFPDNYRRRLGKCDRLLSSDTALSVRILYFQITQRARTRIPRILYSGT